MKLTTEQKLQYIDLFVGKDGAWIELKTKSGKSFVFQPIQQFGQDKTWGKYAIDWANDVQEEYTSDT